MVRGGDYSTSPKKIEEVFGKDAEVLDPESEQPLTPDEHERIANARLLSTPALLSAYGVNAKISDLPEQLQKEIAATLAPLKRPIASEIKKRDESVGKTPVKDFGSSFFDDPLVPSDPRERASLRNTLKRLVSTELPDENKKKLQQHLDLINELDPVIKERQFYSSNIANTAKPEYMSVAYDPNPMIGNDFLTSKLFARKAEGLNRQVQSSITKYQRDVDPRGIGDAVRTRNRTTGALEQAGVGGQWDKPTGRGDSTASADDENMPSYADLEAYAIEISQGNLVKEAAELPEHLRYSWLKSQIQLNMPKELNVLNRPTGQERDAKASQRPNTALDRVVPWSEQANLGNPAMETESGFDGQFNPKASMAEIADEMGGEVDFDENVSPEMIEADIAETDKVTAPDAPDYRPILQAERILRERRGEKSPAQIMAENDAKEEAIEFDRLFADNVKEEAGMQDAGLPEWTEYRDAQEVRDRVGLGKDDNTPLEPDESLGDLTPDELFATGITSLKDGLRMRANLQREVADAFATREFDEYLRDKTSGLNRAILTSSSGVANARDKNAVDPTDIDEDSDSGSKATKRHRDDDEDFTDTIDFEDSDSSLDDGSVKGNKKRKESSGFGVDEGDGVGTLMQSGRLAANRRLQATNWMGKKREEFIEAAGPQMDEFATQWAESHRPEIEAVLSKGGDISMFEDAMVADYFQSLLDSDSFMGKTSPFASLYVKNRAASKFHINNLDFPDKATKFERENYRNVLQKQVEDAITAAREGRHTKQVDASISESVRYEQEVDLKNYWRELTDLQNTITRGRNSGRNTRALERKFNNVMSNAKRAAAQYGDIYGKDALIKQIDNLNGIGVDMPVATLEVSKVNRQQRLNDLKSAGSPAKVFFDNVQDAQEFVAGMPKYESGKAKAELLGDNIVSLKQSALDEAVKKGKIGNQSYTQVQKFYKADDPEAADLDTIFADDTYNTLIATVELSDETSYHREGSHSDAVRQLVQSARDAGIQGVYYDSKNNTLEIIKPHGIESSGWTDSVAAFVASQGNILRRGDTGRDSPTRWAAGRAKRNVAKRSDARIHRGLRRSGRGTEPVVTPTIPQSVKLAKDYAAANPDYNGDHTKWKSSKDFPLKTWSDFDRNDPASDIAFSNYEAAIYQAYRYESENENPSYLRSTPIETAIDTYALNAQDTAMEEGLGAKVAQDAAMIVYELAKINKLLRSRD